MLEIDGAETDDLTHLTRSDGPAFEGSAIDPHDHMGFDRRLGAVAGTVFAACGGAGHGQQAVGGVGGL